MNFCWPSGGRTYWRAPSDGQLEERSISDIKAISSDSYKSAFNVLRCDLIIDEKNRMKGKYSISALYNAIETE